MLWRQKVDRQCIERLKNFQNPPVLVGHVMEMVFTLIGKKTVQRAAERTDYPSKDDHSARYSASSSSTKLTQQKKSKLLSSLNLCYIAAIYSVLSF